MSLEQPLSLAIDVLRARFPGSNPPIIFDQYQYEHVLEFRRKYFFTHGLPIRLTTLSLFSNKVVIPKEEHELKSYIEYIRTGDIVILGVTQKVVNNIKVFKMVKVAA